VVRSCGVPATGADVDRALRRIAQERLDRR